MPPPAPPQCATLSLFRFGPLSARIWVLGQMALARSAFAAMPEARFWKLCGSGTGEGFTPRPDTAVWAILAVWPDEATARDKVAQAPVYRRWAGKSCENWTLFLTPLAARGRWGGATPFVAPAATTACPWADVGEGGPVAALTRATLRPAKLRRFWGRVPDISAAIGTDPNVAFKIGIGEVPFVHQVTFSVWPDTASIRAFARDDGPHARAIRAVRAEGWFREELYARFRIAGDAGTWGTTHPLAGLEMPA